MQRLTFTFHPIRPWALSLALLPAVLAAGSAQALDEAAQLKLGENEYLNSCAACHGVKADGNGPVAEVLSTKPPNLTLISTGFNGTFPREHIYRVIDGRNSINPHGDKQMPVWGFRYVTDAFARANEVPHDVNTQAMVYGRIMSLVGYLESIQKD